MKNTKFLVKVNRGGARAAEYVLRVDRSPIQTTTNRKLALAMGRFTAEDAVKSMQNSRCNPGVSVCPDFRESACFRLFSTCRDVTLAVPLAFPVAS